MKRGMHSVAHQLFSSKNIIKTGGRGALNGHDNEVSLEKLVYRPHRLIHLLIMLVKESAENTCMGGKKEQASKSVNKLGRENNLHTLI